MRKKKQEMLKTQIECQKVKRQLHSAPLLITLSSPFHFLPCYTSLSPHLCFLSSQALINRLEKNRGMKPEERANVMKTLKELTEKITQLQNEMNPSPPSQVPNPKPNHGQPKTKTDVRLDPSLPAPSVLLLHFKFSLA